MATLFTETVQVILDTISDYRGETTTNTDAKRIRAISRAEKAIAKRSPWTLFFYADKTSTTTGASAYVIGDTSYPFRNKGLAEVFVDSTDDSDRYQVILEQDFKNEYSNDSAKKVCYVTYVPSSDAWYMNLSPTPETGLTITYSYYWIPPKRTSVSDTVYCVDMEALARSALAEIYDSEDEGDLAAIERNKVENILASEIGVEEGTYPGQTMVMMGSNQGLGTY